MLAGTALNRKKLRILHVFTSIIFQVFLQDSVVFPGFLCARTAFSHFLGLAARVRLSGGVSHVLQESSVLPGPVLY